MIRLATPADAAQIAAIWNGVIRDTLATFTTQEKTIEETAALITTRPRAFWVAQTEQIDGFATYGAFRNGPGYAATAEHTVILRESAQGRGQGRALMTQLEQAACMVGIHVLVAGISSVNRGAVIFHKRLGFVQSGHLPQVGRKGGQWLDLILMQKTISPR